MNLEVSYNPNDNAFTNLRVADQVIQLPMANGTFDSKMITLSAQYLAHPFEFTVEKNIRSFDSTGFVIGSEPSSSSMGGEYFQLRYFLNKATTLLLRIDRFLIDEDDPNGKNIAAVGNNPHYAHSKDLTIGLSWKFADNWLLSLENHFIDGGAWIPPLGKQTILPPLTEDWQMFVSQISYRF